MYNVKRKTSFYPYVYLKRKEKSHWNPRSKMKSGKSTKLRNFYEVLEIYEDTLLVLVLKYIPLENQNEKTILSIGPFDLFCFNETSATWNETNRHTEHGNKLEATRDEAIKVEAMRARRSSFRKFMDWRIPARLATGGKRNSTNSRDKKLSIGPDERKLAGNWSSPGQQSIETGPGCGGGEVVNRRYSLCNCDRIEAAVSRETMARHNGENGRVIKALGNKVNDSAAEDPRPRSSPNIHVERPSAHSKPIIMRWKTRSILHRSSWMWNLINAAIDYWTVWRWFFVIEIRNPLHFYSKVIIPLCTV